MVVIPTENHLVFFVNGKKIIDDSVDPEWTLLYYLRNKLRLCGTKLGCGEGGCGACTVMVSKFIKAEDRVMHFPVNACLAPVCSMHGLAVTTVEGIGSTKTQLHPVQERIGKSHGTQCGFCTPGIVMSMYCLLRNTPKPQMKEMLTAFQGNLCRCTGYRPIIEGFKTFTEEWELQRSAQNGNGCAMGDKCCKVQNGKSEKETLFETSEFRPYHPTQEPIFPPELKLTDEYNRQFLVIKGPRVTWYRPTTLPQLLDLKEQFPEAKLVNGNTEIGVEVKFKHVNYPVVIQPTQIAEMVAITSTDAEIRIGASVTLANLEAHLKEVVEKLPEFKTRVCRSILETLNLFGGKQIRSVGTLGGNIMTGSPISDMIPILIANGAVLEVQSKKSGIRKVPLNGDFFTGYRQSVVEPHEVLLSINIPYTQEYQFCYAYKQARRREDDIAIVNFAINVKFAPKTSSIEDILLAFGGMSFKTVTAPKTQRKLQGLPWNRTTLDTAYSSLLEDLPLDPEAPGGMIQYRKSLALSLFLRAFLQIQSDLQKYLPNIEINQRELSAIDHFASKDFKSSQYFTVVPESQQKIDLVHRPIVHKSAFKHATGEAEYCDDIPAFENQVHMALVLSTQAHAKIVSIDASEALAMEGVVDFVSAEDLAETRNFCGIEDYEKVFYKDVVTSQGQVIGAIIAQDSNLAKIASHKVKITYEEIQPVIITIQDALKHGSFYEGSEKLFTRGRNIAEVLKEAPHVLKGQCRIGGQEHFYLETQAVAVVPQKEDQELVVYSSTQCPTMLQESLSRVLDLSQSRINVKVKRIGGGFGGKETKSVVLALIASIAARKLNRPVRCMLDRDEDMIFTGGRHPFFVQYQVGFDTSGKILGLDLEAYSNGGYSIDLSASVVERLLLHVLNVYNIPSFHIFGKVCKTNLPSNTAFRGFGAPQAMFIMEGIMQDVAAYLQKDAVDLSELNMYQEGDVTFYNQRLTNFAADKCWHQCITSSNYHQRKEEVAKFNLENRYKKRGLCVIPTMYGIGIPIVHLNQAGSLVHIYTDGSVLLSHGGVEIGQGLLTKMLQVASKALGIPIEKIHTTDMSTDKVPNSTATVGSISSDVNGMAVLEACNVLNDRLRPYKEANPKGTWEQWVKSAYFDRTSLSATGFFKTPGIGHNWDTGEGDLMSYFVHGAACCEAEIDTLTGDHQVHRVDIVMDLGQSLNPAIDVGQIEGAFMQGYGLFVLEELVYSPTGANYTRGPGTYKLPGFADIPGEFNVSLLKAGPDANPRAVYSSKGVGEPPLFLGSSVYFSIKNAIRAARKENGLSQIFPLDSPATAARIRMACEDEITAKFPEPKPGSFKPWSVSAST